MTFPPVIRARKSRGVVSVASRRLVGAGCLALNEALEVRAEAAGVQKLVLTHLLSTEDDVALTGEARSLFSGEVYVGRDGLVLEV